MAVKKKGIKKTVSRKRKNSKRNQKLLIFTELKKILVGITILVFVCLAIAMAADVFFGPQKTASLHQSDLMGTKTVQTKTLDQDQKKKIAVLKEKSDDPIKYEVFEDIDHTVLEKPAPPEKDHMPQIAIIIDDIGYDKNISLAICDLNSNITFSVLPFAPFGKVVSEKMYVRGSQLMLHLPMEPVGYPQINPGPGAILSLMPPDALIDQLRKNIKDIPHIVGVNNHMGSKLTSHSDQMNQIFTILKKENLFFVDSRTSAKSQCKASARLLKIKFAQRDVFLDNVQDPEYIAGQLKKLIHRARKNGSALGIGHPYRATLEALSKELPKMKNKVKIVRASVLTAIPE
jgi:uncharacterized protein